MTDRRRSAAGNVRWVLLVTAGVALSVALLDSVLFLVLEQNGLIYDENGILEIASVLFWAMAFVISIVSAVRAGSLDARLMAVWLAVVALAAGLRECDAQIWFNPKTIGSWGVRYKISWWLDGSVPLGLKLGWAGLFLCFFLLMAYPPLKLLRQGLALLKTGDRMILLLMASVVFLALGFVIDDFMRGSDLVSTDTRQLVEESSELVGSMLFAMAAVLENRRPWHERLGSVRVMD